MWAAFLEELTSGKPLSRFAGCATPEESAVSHQVFTAALASHDQSAVVDLQQPAIGLQRGKAAVA
jgi:hypothetical protein